MLVAYDSPCMNAKNITLRPGRPADAARIAAMSRDLIESGLGWSWGPERVARSIANKDTFTLLACDRDRVVGIATIHLELRAANTTARSFYRSLGFTESAYIPGYYRGREMALRMMRVLRKPGAPLPAWPAPKPPKS